MDASDVGRGPAVAADTALGDVAVGVVAVGVVTVGDAVGAAVGDVAVDLMAEGGTCAAGRGAGAAAGAPMSPLGAVAPTVMTTVPAADAGPDWAADAVPVAGHPE